MTKKIFVLFAMISIFLMACSKNENQTSTPDTSEKNTDTQSLAASDTKKDETKDTETITTEENKMDIKILEDNKLIINTEKVQSIAVRDGNTGKTVLDVTDKNNISKISEDISSVEFTEHEEIPADGWRYELIISSDEDIHIVICSNSQLYIKKGSEKTDCETSFDLIGYIENTILNSEK